MVRNFRSRTQTPSSVLSLNRLLTRQEREVKKETSAAERLLRILLLGTAGIILLTGLAFILF